MSLRAWLLIAVALVAAVVAVAVYARGQLDGLERRTVDARFRARASEGPPAGIAIVGLDQKTLGAVNARPPIPRRYYADLLDRLHAAGARLIALDTQFIGETDPADDEALVAAIGRNGPVLLATHDEPVTGPVPVPAGRQQVEGAILASVGIDTDTDNVVRWMLYAPVALKSFPVRAAELLTGKEVSERNFPNNRAWIDFRGPPGTFATYSFIDVLNGTVPASAFAGKAVLVGVTDPVEDVFLTAVSSKPMSGVELHANGLATILDGFPLTSAGGPVNILLVLILAALPALLTARLPALYSLIGVLAVAALFLLGNQLAFNSGHIAALVSPGLALALSAVGSTASDAFIERRQRENLQRALGELLPPPSPSAFFISYRRDQSRWAARDLKRELTKRFGESSVFMDTGSISAGEEWPRRVQTAIRGCSVMLVLMGPHWLEERNGVRRIDDPTDWVRREVEGGLRRADAVVVPVLLDGARCPAEGDLPDSIKELARRQAVALTGDHLEEEIDELVRSIERGRVRDVAAPTVRIRSENGRSDERAVKVTSELTIGRSESADIVLDDDAVADQHARIWPVLDGVMVEDLGAEAGTWLDDQRIDTRVRVGDGATIRIGSRRLVIELRRIAG